MSVVVDIKLESPQWDAVSDTENTVRRAIYAAVAEVGPSDAELGVVLADDARIRTLNRIWLGNDKATNVLSFPSPPGTGRQPALPGRYRARTRNDSA
jgi:probable rRNA maturation factor